MTQKSRGKRKLSDQQVIEIVEKFKQGLKRSVLAREYGVAHGSVSSIVYGKTYRWLTGIAPTPVAA